MISVVSGKGGTGKTTITANLGAALSKMGKSVLVIDGNVSGANLGTHLGLSEESQVTLNEVLKEKAFMTQAVIKHPSGFSVIPAQIEDINNQLGGLKPHLADFIGNYNYILIDAAAGITKEVESAVDAADEVLIITNPEIPAVKNAGVIRKLADSKGKTIIGVVLNKVSGEKHEISQQEVEKIVQAPVISKISHHRKVGESLAIKQPVVHHAPHTRSGYEIMNLAHLVAGEKMPQENFSDFLKRFWNIELSINIG